MRGSGFPFSGHAVRRQASRHLALAGRGGLAANSGHQSPSSDEVAHHAALHRRALEGSGYQWRAGLVGSASPVHKKKNFVFSLENFLDLERNGHEAWEKKLTKKKKYGMRAVRGMRRK